jgi:hypothetical protein
MFTPSEVGETCFLRETSSQVLVMLSSTSLAAKSGYVGACYSGGGGKRRDRIIVTFADYRATLSSGKRL